MNKHQLIIKQLDKQFQPWHQIKQWYKPKCNWIHTIRKALGITTKQLAKKLDVDRSRVVRIESDELKGALTIQTLNAIANALNCDFIYVLVPKKPLCKILGDQAQKIATLRIKRVSNNMLLENQALSTKQNKSQIKELREILLTKSPKKLWDEQ